MAALIPTRVHVVADTTAFRTAVDRVAAAHAALTAAVTELTAACAELAAAHPEFTLTLVPDGATPNRATPTE